MDLIISICVVTDGLVAVLFLDIAKMWEIHADTPQVALLIMEKK